MVLEALAAIGLAGNVVQFVHFVGSLVAKSRQIRRSALGLADETCDLEVIAKHLHEYLRAFGSDSSGLGAVSSLATRCEDVATELLTAISELKQNQKRSKVGEKFGSFRKALKSVWKKEELLGLQSRLESLRDELMLQLVSKSSIQQTNLLSTLQTLKAENVRNDFNRTNQISNVSLAIQRINDTLPNLASTVDLNSIRKEFQLFTSQLKILSERQTTKRDKILLESLRFPKMALRFSNISLAHSRTFDWIFHTERLAKFDPRSNIQLASWLECGEGVYWISGKPGSGKSTLMKYLEHNHLARQRLHQWAKGLPLFVASFYFWNAGTTMQKSLLGLLQSLLYAILSGCPKLIPILCPERTSHENSSIKISDPWNIPELRQAFSLLKDQAAVPIKFYLHVDGLDEYDGDHFEIIDILKSVGMAPNVKLLVSSRPWNCFEKAFGKILSHKLYLHDLTKEDIELCTRERLQAYIGDACLQQRNACDNLVAQILDRAQGVFLWVYLVINSLRNGFTNDDDIETLQRRLMELPTDLEEFFEHIMNSVEPVYKEAMAFTMMVASEAPEPLQIVHYSFLGERPEFVYQRKYEPFEPAMIRSRLVETHTRLNGRYKGLLELSRYQGDLTPDATVDFLHRTLRDYLRTPKVNQQLMQKVPNKFNSFVEIGRALLATAKFASGDDRMAFEKPVSWARKITRQLKDASEEYVMYDAVEVAMRERWIALGFTSDPGMLMLRNSVILNNVGYVKYRLSKHGVSEDINALLQLALLPRQETRDKIERSLSWNLRPPEQLTRLVCYPDMVEQLLSAGADPNALLGTTTIWSQFVNFFTSKSLHSITQDGFHAVLALMLKHGANFSHDPGIYVEYLSSRRLTILRDGNCNILLGAMRMCKLLLEYGLNPNTASSNMTFWRAYLYLDCFALQVNPTKSLRAEILECFLFHGARLDAIFAETDKELTWFEYTLNTNLAGALVDNHDVVASFEVMFKFGLDPNLPWQEETVWKHVIHQIQTSRPSYPPDDLHWTASLIILFLQYGADPFAEELHSLLGLTYRERSIFGTRGIENIRAVLNKEMDCVSLGRQSMETQYSHGKILSANTKKRSHGEYSSNVPYNSPSTAKLSRRRNN